MYNKNKYYMAKKRRFEDKDLITFSSEFDNINKLDFDSTIWTTKEVEELIDKVENHGLDLDSVKHPFFNNNINVRRGNSSFNYTDEELDELKRCKKDVIYFANNYAKVMQETGIKQITLYPYQEDMLRLYTNEKYSIAVGSRQIGKCILADTQLVTEEYGTIKAYELLWKYKKNKTVYTYIKHILYKLYSFFS